MTEAVLGVGSSDQGIYGFNQWERRPYIGLSRRRSKHSKYLPYFIQILADHFGGDTFRAIDVENLLIEKEREEKETNPDFYSSKTAWTPYERLDSNLFQRGIVERILNFHPYGYNYRFIPESLRELGF